MHDLYKFFKFLEEVNSEEEDRVEYSLLTCSSSIGKSDLALWIGPYSFELDIIDGKFKGRIRKTGDLDYVRSVNYSVEGLIDSIKSYLSESEKVGE